MELLLHYHIVDFYFLFCTHNIFSRSLWLSKEFNYWILLKVQKVVFRSFESVTINFAIICNYLEGM